MRGGRFIQIGHGLLVGALIILPLSSSVAVETSTPTSSPAASASPSPESTVPAEGYSLGDTGPGGGYIFFVDKKGFKCGPKFSNNGSPTGGLCHYLEVAPSGWQSGKIGDRDPYMDWSTEANHFKAVKGIERVNINCRETKPPSCLAGSAVGIGYLNSVVIVKQGNGITTAAGASRAYRGGSKSDWYLPSLTELNNLLKWAQGVPWKSNTTEVTGGTTNSPVYGATAARVESAAYSTSTEMYRDNKHTGNRSKFAHNVAWVIENIFTNATMKTSGIEKTDSIYVRPIRAF
jgi:hypothetical protein